MSMFTTGACWSQNNYRQETYLSVHCSLVFTSVSNWYQLTPTLRSRSSQLELAVKTLSDWLIVAWQLLHWSWTLLTRPWNWSVYMIYIGPLLAGETLKRGLGIQLSNSERPVTRDEIHPLGLDCILHTESTG